LLSFSTVVFAQTVVLRGVVTDESGAVVRAATVTLTSPAGARSTAVTGDDGSYSFAGIGPGDYTAQASAPDLRSDSIKVTIKPGVQTLDIRLKVAPVAQQVTVQERAAAVTTDPANNASATVLAGDDLNALPDDPDDLLAALVALVGTGAGPSGISLLIDGFSASEAPSKDSIREIRINQNQFSPEYDKLGTGRIEIVTKAGGKELHGTDFFNFADDFWNSRNPYAQQKAPFLLREYGGNLSGPMSARGSFYFDLRRDATDNGAILNGTTLDPGTLSIIDPYTNVFRIPQRRLSMNPRADYQLGANHTLTMRYTFTHIDIPYSGIGGFNLISRGVATTTTAHTVQATETAVLGEKTVNETRFQFSRTANETTTNTTGPVIQVLGSFNGGASPTGHSFDTQTNQEFQDTMTMIRGAHTLRFGVRLRGQADDSISPLNFNGTFTFGGGVAPVLDASNQPVLDSSGQPILAPITSIQRYQRTLLLQRLGFSASQIAGLGGGATQFSIVTGDPTLSASQIDAGAFIGDDWKAGQALTVSLGFRYEAQTNIHDRHDVAPRVGIAWALRPKTVIRAGFGMFYDRFGLGNTMTALRQNGVRQQNTVVTNPDFFPSIPAVSSLTSLQATQIQQQVSPVLVSPRLYQTAFGIERQLSMNTTVAVTYVNSHGLQMFRSRTAGAIFLMESSGLYNQNQVTVNVNARANKYVSLTGSYTLNRAMSNTDGFGTFPSNPSSSVGEYSPAATDVRHRVSLNGSINTKWNLAFSPLVNIASGPPFDITVGRDLYGTTLFNGRPGIATDPSKPGLIQTVYGLLDPNPTPGETLLHRNYGRGPGTMSVNLRIAKTVRLGSKPASAGADANRPYTLSISIATQNILNHTNPGPIIGNLTSPLFGRANQPAGGSGFGGFSEAANNRRLELQTRFTF
jgi:hypothetical protein